MTSKGRAAGFRVPITHDGKKGLILLDQLRAIDKTRLVKKLGATPVKTLHATLSVLQETFAL
jgi:mRNA interferase MazF